MKTINELLEEYGKPDEPMPEAPPWHVDGIHNCAHGWIIGGEPPTWGICDCEDPATPWPPRVIGDGPRDCQCFGCHCHVPRYERGKLAECEYKDHHCDNCHENRRCTIMECGFWVTQ